MTSQETVTVRFAGQDREVTLQQILQEIVNAAMPIANGRRPIDVDESKDYLLRFAHIYTNASKKYNLAVGTGVMIPIGLGANEYLGSDLPQEWHDRINSFIEQFGNTVANLGQQQADKEKLVAEIKRIARTFGCTAK